MPHYNVRGDATRRPRPFRAISLKDPRGGECARQRNPRRADSALAGLGIGDFNHTLKWSQLKSPLRGYVTIEDVGGAAQYSFSDFASDGTGEVHEMNAAYRQVGMMQEVALVGADRRQAQ